MVAGILILGTVENAMNLLNISPFSQYVVRGLILLAAVIFDRYKQKQSVPCNPDADFLLLNL